MIDTKAASPNSTGPAGARLEAGVAAHYLLALLRGGEALGLPAVRLTRVKLQRAGADHPLDDVIVEGLDARGKTVGLDIQVKRDVRFSPGDAVFKKVMGQVADTLRLGQAAQQDRSLAIAMAQTSHKIDGPYQDVLTWARAIGEPAVFFDRIRRKGSGNDDARRLVETVAVHLAAEGLSRDDAEVWALLRRLQILVFDLERDGSVLRALSHEQCLSALAPDQSDRAKALWSALESQALAIAAQGGDVTRQQLVDALAPQGFQFAAERRHEPARAVLEEASSQVLAEIDDRLGDVVLLRPQAVAAVDAALDQGRYVEIRGAGGVGKSSLLKHLARQVGGRGRVIALNAERTLAGGWPTLRAALGFAGTARELLVDIAAAGGGVLLIDGVDNFAPPARALVRDLIGAAVEVPGFQVVVTARSAFGTDEENWLPLAQRDALGQAPPVMLAELSDDEVAELRHAAPGLAPLLADAHPARAVARNLYRLRRLIAQGDAAAQVRTEVDLADLWWRTADGPDIDRRVRARVLQNLADQLLAGSALLETRHCEPAALDALIRSETLRDLGGERAVFRHDVLRDWALFGRLRERPEALSDAALALAPGPAMLRALELLARDRLERGQIDAWRELLARVSQAGRHNAWRRGVLLAVVRSESASRLLDLAAGDLLADEGRLLRDLIRLTLAVDGQTLGDLLPQIAQTPAANLADIVVPSGPSWSRLVEWLVDQTEALPQRALPDVIWLWARWLQVGSGYGAGSRKIVRQFHIWLSQVLDDRERPPASRTSGFGQGFDQGLYGGVVRTLRLYGVGFATAAPQLASAYLDRLLTMRHGHEDADWVVLNPGELAVAAPQPLAALTFARLAEKPSRATGSLDDRWRFLDNQFLPESPSHGPFLGILRAAPAIGLGLVRRLVAHAIDARDDATTAPAADLEDLDEDDFDLAGPVEEADGEAETLRLRFDDGERLVTHLSFYELSRPMGSQGYAVASALMALEAWAQARVEAGEPLARVIDDVLGEGPIIAPFLLVAVDLLLCHWSGDAAALALPLVGDPRLLVMDFWRQHNERSRYGPMRMIGSGPEPGQAPFRTEDLAARASRRSSLAGLVQLYAHGDAAHRAELQERLETAAAALGPDAPSRGWSDSAFMAANMLHMLDQTNWRVAPDPNGSGEEVWVYTLPGDREREARAAEAMRPINQLVAESALGAAAEDPAKSHADQVDYALRVARGEVSATRYDSATEGGARDAAKTMAAAALVLARDLDPERWLEVCAWVAERVQAGLAAQEREGGSLRYDVAGMAFVTLVHRLRRDWRRDDLEKLLISAASPRHKAHAGFAAAFEMIEALDARLPRGVLRCALSARVTSWLPWDAPAATAEAEKTARTDRIQAAVAAELAWLLDDGPEPAWPAFPERRPRPAVGVRLPVSQDQPAPGPEPTGHAPDEDVDGADEDVADDEAIAPVPTVEEGAAAEWLDVIPSDGATARPWRLDLVRAYASWTYAKNGSGLGRHARFDANTSRWNTAFFAQLAYAAPHMADGDIDVLLLDPLAALPDKQRLEIAPAVLRPLDEVYFNDEAVSAEFAVTVRDAIAGQVKETRGWADLRGKSDGRAEVTLGPAVATLFFSRRGYGRGSYLKGPGVDRLDPFLPMMTRLAADCPSLTVANALLDTLEAKPRSAFVAVMLSAAEGWLATFPDDTRFWRDNEVGPRICAVFETLRASEPGALCASGARLDTLLGGLVALGVAEAGRLERWLATASSAPRA